MDDSHKSQNNGKISKQTKLVHRTAKRSNAAPSHPSPVNDARHKRVWKACERCRMKKTKCDGESPCKRCKDDGLVCTAGSRKKTEYKQLPRGYAEVLENNHHALVATVHKLYTMVRNGETWKYEEPELNDRGQPAVHDIANALGCLRLSPDLPYDFLEKIGDFDSLGKTEDLMTVETDLPKAPSVKKESENAWRSRKHSEDPAYPSPISRSSSESGSDHSSENEQQRIPQDRELQRHSKIYPPAISTNFEGAISNLPPLPFDQTASSNSPYTDFTTDSPLAMYDDVEVDYAPWAANSLFQPLGQGMDLNSPVFSNQNQFRMPTDCYKPMQGLELDGIVAPRMLERSYYDCGADSMKYTMA